MGMYRYDLTKISVTHEAVADWLICNPGKGQLKKCAKHFGYTPSYIYTLVGTDSFQAVMKAKQGDTFEQVVIPIKEKIMGAAHAGLDRVGEIIETSKDERLVKDATKDMLTALGYLGGGGGAARGSGVTINNQTNIQINQTELEAARQRRSDFYRSSNAGHALNDDSDLKKLTEELRTSQELIVGEAREIRSETTNDGEEVYGGEGSGD